jgi:hypothetical protein
MLSANVWLLLFNQRKYLDSAIAPVCNKNLSFFIDAHLGGIVNPVRKSSAFQRGGSHGALNPVFALKGLWPGRPPARRELYLHPVRDQRSYGVHPRCLPR